MSEIWSHKHWPNFWFDNEIVGSNLAAASEAIGRVRGLRDGLSTEEQQALDLSQIVRETIASFNIEGVTLQAEAIEASVVASFAHRQLNSPERRSDAIVTVMTEARLPGVQITEDRLCSWHRLLFHSVELEDKGRWRRFELEIVKSAAAGRNDVLYRPVPSGAVAAEMERFFCWLQRPMPLHVLLRAPLAHLWFESILPFSDGNGRIGRALIEAIFAQESPLLFALSPQIEREKKSYYAALQAGRRVGTKGIDATPFVNWFLGVVARAADNAAVEMQFLVRKTKFFFTRGPHLNVRQKKALALLFEQGPTRVDLGLTAKSYCKMTGASPATATRDLTALHKTGVLKRGDEGGRSTKYLVNY